MVDTKERMDKPQSNTEASELIKEALLVVKGMRVTDNEALKEALDHIEKNLTQAKLTLDT